LAQLTFNIKLVVLNRRRTELKRLAGAILVTQILDSGHADLGVELTTH